MATIRAPLPPPSQPPLAALRRILPDTLATLEPPTLKIRFDEDVDAWRTTRGYRDYAIFLRRLNESVVGHMLNDGKEGQDSLDDSEPIRAIIRLLDELDSWIDEIPPQPTPQRFGNLAFRTWGKRLAENAEQLIKSLLPAHLAVSAPLIIPYLLESFGSPTRIDYGTGHETCFALFLLCLTLVGFFGATDDPQTERVLVLSVFLRYLRLCWRLQDVYRLEPAGSHGVWGLDDYSFLGYIFGSAQLRDQNVTKPADVLRSPLPPTNLYFLQISRIHALKTGPFHEHSSQLHSIAVGVPFWAKVNTGLIKMYEAEVLGKRVVVQHIPLGGLLEWDPDVVGAFPQRNEVPSAAVAAATSRPTGMPAPPQSGMSFSPTSAPTGMPLLAGSNRFASTSTPPSRRAPS